MQAYLPHSHIEQPLSSTIKPLGQNFLQKLIGGHCGAGGKASFTKRQKMSEQSTKISQSIIMVQNL